MKEKKIAFGFWITGLSCLVLGLLFGMAGSLQYVMPGFLKDDFSFTKMRPLHVFLITQWIICAAVGSMYYFLPSISNRKIAFPLLARMHLYIQLFIIMVAISDFFNGHFTGREYLEFPVWAIALMIFGWISAGINLLFTIKPAYNTAPVYIWSWSTGILFFIITLTEASLWQFDHFNGNIIRDITVQWKALGSMVGAWNMLIYGSALYVMCKISGSDDMARSKQAFFFYFLGMANLMFNWGHHTYIVPASPIIKNTAYLISMTELLILFNMIWKWGKSLSKADKEQHASYRLLKMTDNWIILNLALALAMSVPAINAYTHGTHITVAHAMGATIGINTTILLAAGYFIYGKERKHISLQLNSKMKRTLWVFNIALGIFWCSLIGSGVVKASAITSNKIFYDIMQQLKPWFHVFSASGFVLTGAIVVLAAPLIKQFFASLTQTHRKAAVVRMNEVTTVRVITTEEKEEV